MPPDVLAMIGSWDIVAWNTWSSHFVYDHYMFDGLCVHECFETGEWINDRFVLGAQHPRAESLLDDWVEQQRWETYGSLQSFFTANEWFLNDCEYGSIFGHPDLGDVHPIVGGHKVTSRRVVVRSRIRLSHNVSIPVLRYGWILDRSSSGSLENLGDFVISHRAPPSLDLRR